MILLRSDNVSFISGQQFLNATKEPSDIEKIVADLAKETVHPSYRPVSETSSDSNGVAGEPSNASNQFGGKQAEILIYFLSFS